LKTKQKTDLDITNLKEYKYRNYTKFRINNWKRKTKQRHRIL